MAAIEEKHRDGGSPERRDCLRAADDRHDRILQACFGNEPAEDWEAINSPVTADQFWIVVFLARLVLLRAAVVVDGEYHRADFPSRSGEIQRRLAAVSTDLDDGSQTRDGKTGGIERQALRGWHKALSSTCKLKQTSVHLQRSDSEERERYLVVEVEPALGRLDAIACHGHETGGGQLVDYFRASFAARRAVGAA